MKRLPVQTISMKWASNRRQITFRQWCYFVTFGSIIQQVHGLQTNQRNKGRNQIIQDNCHRFISRVNRFDRITPIPNDKNTLNLCFIHNFINSVDIYHYNIFSRTYSNTRTDMNTMSSLVNKVSKTRYEFEHRRVNFGTVYKKYTKLQTKLIAQIMS